MLKGDIANISSWGLTPAASCYSIMAQHNQFGKNTMSESAAMAAAHASLIGAAQALVRGTGVVLPYFPETDRHFDKIIAVLPIGLRHPLPKKV